MLNPIRLPAELLGQIQALSDAVQSLPSIERMLDARLGRLESRLESLPNEIEAALRDHFERQQQGVQTMHTQLEANREAAEELPGRLERLRADLQGVLSEITRVRETLEPLQGPAERLARMDQRLPGGS